MSSSWIIQVDPKSNGKCLYKRKAMGDLREKIEKRGKRCEKGGSDCSNAKKQAKEHQQPPEVRGGKDRILSLGPSERQDLDFRLLAATTVRE